MLRKKGGSFPTNHIFEYEGRFARVVIRSYRNFLLSGLCRLSSNSLSRDRIVIAAIHNFYDSHNRVAFALMLRSQVCCSRNSGICAGTTNLSPIDYCLWVLTLLRLRVDDRIMFATVLARKISDFARTFNKREALQDFRLAEWSRPEGRLRTSPFAFKWCGLLLAPACILLNVSFGDTTSRFLFSSLILQRIRARR